MNRRQFLRLTREREVELSCRWLYMRCLDLASRSGAFVEARREQPEPTTTDESLLDTDSWQPGEPDAAFAPRSGSELFAELDAALAGADVLRLTEVEWLHDPCRGPVEQLVEAFRARGGRVERSEDR